MVMDLSVLEERAVFERFLPDVDGVVENFSPRVMPNLRLDYDTLQARNAGLISVSLPAFACSSHVAYGSGLELAAGLGETGPGGEPQAAPVPYIDYLAGCYGAIAFLGGLLQREQSGYGCHVEVPQYEVARQLLDFDWVPRTLDQWDAAAWTPYAPAGHIHSEREPLSGHLRGPAWHVGRTLCCLQTESAR
jgi:crotonobetainyl-CoA:carnitine CoA-transferase CaiB-like acyl-CoA transferase